VGFKSFYQVLSLDDAGPEQTTAEESNTEDRSSSLESLTLLDLASELQSVLTGIFDPPPQMGRKTKRKLLNLILLNVPGLGHAQERFSPPCSPLDNLSQPKRKVFGRSPTFIRPRSVLSFFLAKPFLTSSYSIKEGSGRLLSYVVRELGWSCLFFSQNLVVSLVRWVIVASAISNRFGLVLLLIFFGVSLGTILLL